MSQRPLMQGTRPINFFKVLLAIAFIGGSSVAWSVTTTFSEHAKAAISERGTHICPQTFPSGWTDCFGAITIHVFKYVGHFKEGKPHGLGILYNNAGSLKRGEWEYGQFKQSLGLRWEDYPMTMESRGYLPTLMPNAPVAGGVILPAWKEAALHGEHMATDRKTVASFSSVNKKCIGDISGWDGCIGEAGYRFLGNKKILHDFRSEKFEYFGDRYIGWFKKGLPDGLGVGYNSSRQVFRQGFWQAGRLERETGETPEIRGLLAFHASRDKQESVTTASNGKQCSGKLETWHNCWGIAAAKKLNNSQDIVTSQELNPLSGSHYLGWFWVGNPVGVGIFYEDVTTIGAQGIWGYESTRTKHGGGLVVTLPSEKAKVKELRQAHDMIVAEVRNRAAEFESASTSEGSTITAASRADDKKEIERLKAQLAALQSGAVNPPKQDAPVLADRRRVALVIGNSKYEVGALANPANDARDMAAALKRQGFKVIKYDNLTLRQTQNAMRQFADEFKKSDVGLVYYSGHGVEAKGVNYLIPVNANIRREYELTGGAYPASQITGMMEEIQASGDRKRVAILILDACRDNPLTRSWRSSGGGLARMDAPAGTFISFATSPGSVASDGVGRNSPFTKHLLQAMKKPNVPIELMFKEVRVGVVNETRGEQVPWESSSLMGDFYFNRTK